MRSTTALSMSFLCLALLSLTKGSLTLDDQASQVVRDEFNAKLESYDAIISDLRIKSQRYEEHIKTYETTVKQIHKQIAENKENHEHAIASLKQKIDQCEDMVWMKPVYPARPVNTDTEIRETPAFTAIVDQPDQVSARDTRKASRDEAPRQAAFYAELSTDLTHIGDYQTIVFDYLTTNIGNGYDTSDGEFTAPIAGIYVFIWSTASRIGHSLQSELVANGEVHGRLWSYSDIYATTASATGCVVLKLNVGDKVWIRATTLHDNHITGNRMSTFSGWLLY